MEIPIWVILLVVFLMSFGLGLGIKLMDYLFSKKKTANKLEISVDRNGVEIIEKKRLQPITSTKTTTWQEEE